MHSMTPVGRFSASALIALACIAPGTESSAADTPDGSAAAPVRLYASRGVRVRHAEFLRQWSERMARHWNTEVRILSGEDEGDEPIALVQRASSDGRTLLLHESVSADGDGHPAGARLAATLLSQPAFLVVPATSAATDLRTLLQGRGPPATRVVIGNDAVHAKAAGMLRGIGGGSMSSPALASPSSALAVVLERSDYYTIASGPACVRLIREGKLRALAVLSHARAPFFPDVPTALEAGDRNVRVGRLLRIYVPPSTPAGVVGRIGGDATAMAVQIRLDDDAVDQGWFVVAAAARTPG